MKRTTVTMLAVMFIAAAATAQLSAQFNEWARGPAKFLMTKDEVKQWSAIRTDADAKAFIDLFWARRDPTPDTPRNEFQEDFDARVAFADKNFGGATAPGSMTDRGKAFILLGPPFRVSGKAGEQAEGMGAFNVGPGNAPTNARGELIVGAATSGRDQQFWMYSHENKPKFVPQADFTLVFTHENNGEWIIGTTERANPEIMFAAAANASIVSPKMTKAPVYVTAAPAHNTAFKSADLKTAYEQFRAGDKTALGPATLTDAEFVSSEGVHFVSAQMYVPAGGDITAGQKLTFLSVVEDKDGRIVDVREDAATMTAIGNDTYVDKSLELEPGTYNVTFALADGGKILAAERAPLTVQGLDPNANALSPLLLATNVYPMKTTWHPTDPFIFGGLKVVPKGDSVFPTAGDLWYFVEVRNPGVTDTGVPNLRVRVDIAGKTAKGAVRLNLPMQDAEITKLQQEKNRYALGLAIPLESFLPGEYTMKVHITDVVLGKDYDLQKAFKIRG